MLYRKSNNLLLVRTICLQKDSIIGQHLWLDLRIKFSSTKAQKLLNSSRGFVSFVWIRFYLFLLRLIIAIRLVQGIWNLGSKAIGNPRIEPVLLLSGHFSRLWPASQIWPLIGYLGMEILIKSQVQNAFPPVSKDVKQLEGFLLQSGRQKGQKIILNGP